ncbi:hypothetical protein SK128_021381, partial [Halocaridina rubra]
MSQFSVQLLGYPLLSAPLPFRCSAVSHLDYIDNNVSTVKNSSYYNSKCLSDQNTSLPVPLHINGTYATQQRTNILSCPVVEYETSTFTSTIISQ